MKPYREYPLLKTLITTLFLLTLLYTPCRAETFITETSYYTRASCLKESGQCVMANGKELQDDKLIAASWDYPFGQRLRLTDVESGRQVTVVVSDRGPAKKLYKKGRKLDISKRAFEILSGKRLDKGTLQVIVKPISFKNARTQGEALCIRGYAPVIGKTPKKVR